MLIFDKIFDKISYKISYKIFYKISYKISYKIFFGREIYPPEYGSVLPNQQSWLGSTDPVEAGEFILFSS